MPDDNRFAGLSDVVEEESDEGDLEDGTDREAAASTDSDDDDGDTMEATYDDPEVSADDADEAGEADAEADETEDDPAAFPFDATTKKTVYVRGETIDDLEDARALVDAQLRTEHDVRDLTGREFYDAVFRLAAEDTDGLVDEIRDERED